MITNVEGSEHCVRRPYTIGRKFVHMLVLRIYSNLS